MKKILAIAAVLILLLTLAVPAFAVDADDVDLVSSVEAEPETLTATDGTPVVIGPVDEAEVSVGTLVVVVNAVDANVDGVEVYDISAVDASGNPVDRDTPITVDIPFDQAQLVVAVLIKNDDGSWTSVPFTADADSVLCQFPHLTPVAFVLGTKVEPAPGTEPAPGPGTEPAPGPGPVPSPQTGYSIALWAILAVAMVACAGYCFVSARKKTAE